MTTHVLRGSKQEIVERLTRLGGDVREAIVFVEDPASPAAGASPPDVDDIFAEMRPFMVEAPAVDDSRAAIYARTAGE
jgi:hypothetical protein